MSRFKLTEAKRGALPLFIGLCGPSGGGKTFSAHRLSQGIRRVVGGRVACLDTEANRSLHYAPKPGESPVPGVTFDFDHCPFTAPFSPLDYMEALRECINAGAKTVIIDSFSHEHEGPGGVLEWHQEEQERLAKEWRQPEHKVTFPAWAKPKAARIQLLHFILQQQVNLICCFRAKRKLEMPKKGSNEREPRDMGWMPIAGQEYAYEMTALGVLPPGAKGVPDWNPVDPGSEMVTKRPKMFEDILKPGAQLSEDMGEAMARWAQGAPAAAAPPKAPAFKHSADGKAYLGRMAHAVDVPALLCVQEDLMNDNTLSPEETQQLEAQLKRRRAQLEGTGK